MDKIDRKILRLLQADATTPIAEIARQVNLSQTPSWNRIRRMEHDEVITGRIALVDARKVGLGLTAFVSIEAASHDRAWTEAFKSVVGALPEVMDVWRMAGETDYLLRVVTADMAAYDRFYHKLTEGVAIKKVTSHFTMEHVLARTVLPL